MSALLWWCDFTYTICRVTLPTERVSWNCVTRHALPTPIRHAPHGACELKYLYSVGSAPHLRHAPHGACELKWSIFVTFANFASHAPHGACELKYLNAKKFVYLIPVTLPTERVSWNECQQVVVVLHCVSRSPRSVWVEIAFVVLQMPRNPCHAPHGACELKLSIEVEKYERVCHAPHGACELKCMFRFSFQWYCLVTLPTERVSWNPLFHEWRISKSGHAPHGACELKFQSYTNHTSCGVSRSPRSVWVEIVMLFSSTKCSRSSRYPRSVWVEIYRYCNQ